jgi:hypothetical protein
MPRLTALVAAPAGLAGPARKRSGFSCRNQTPAKPAGQGRPSRRGRRRNSNHEGILAATAEFAKMSCKVDLVKQREVIETFAAASAVGDFSQISRAWSEFFYDLQGARGVFVVNDSKYDKPILPTDTSFEGKCNLIGLLKGRQLGLKQNAGSTRPFRYTWYIFADTNFVSYCNTVYSGKNLGANAEAFYAAGDYLMTKRDGLSPICYLIENFERRHLPQVKSSLKAFVAFKFADADAFRRTRKISPTISEKDLEKTAAGVMASLETCDFKTIYDQMKLHYFLSRIVLAKMAAVDFGPDKGKSAKHKLLKLLEYFDQEMAMLPQIELHAAWRYYEIKSQEPFFKTVQQNAGDLLGSIHSMSWDLAHWRNAMTLTTVHSILGIGAPFPIPYVLTFDHGFSSLLRQLQVKGIIYLDNDRCYISVPDNQNKNLQSLSDVLNDAEHLLTPAAVANRQKRRLSDNALLSHFERLAQSASQELAALVGKNK